MINNAYSININNVIAYPVPFNPKSNVMNIGFDPLYPDSTLYNVKIEIFDINEKNLREYDKKIKVKKVGPQVITVITRGNTRDISDSLLIRQNPFVEGYCLLSFVATLARVLVLDTPMLTGIPTPFLIFFISEWPIADISLSGTSLKSINASSIEYTSIAGVDILNISMTLAEISPYSGKFEE